MLCKSGRGFSLIETAVVLGVIGLVVAGIWIASSSVSSSKRTNDTVAALLRISGGTRNLFRNSPEYPTVFGTLTNVVSTLYAVGVIPNDFDLKSSTYVVSPEGITMGVALACYTPCPMLEVAVYGPTAGLESKVSSAECVQIIRRFAGLAKDSNDLLFVQVAVPGNATYQMLSTPIDPAAVDCPSNFEYVVFWFTP